MPPLLFAPPRGLRCATDMFNNNRGLAYRDKGEIDRAIADFRRALEINPSYQDPKENLGVLRATMAPHGC